MSTKKNQERAKNKIGVALRYRQVITIDKAHSANDENPHLKYRNRISKRKLFNLDVIPKQRQR